MRFYNVTHKYYCGIDLHARNMYTCVLDQEGKNLLHRDLPTDPDVFLKAIAPFRDNLAVAVECIFTWYWLAGLCAREGIDFVLGHALYMKEIHDIDRFERVQNFASYARLVKCEKSSSGKRLGTGGAKIGNVHLKWAFSEAAVLFLRANPPAQRYVEKLQKNMERPSPFLSSPTSWAEPSTS